MRISLIQVASPDNETSNERRDRVSKMVLGTDADLVVLPELWAAGYFNFDRYSEESEPFEGRTVTDAAAWALQLGCYVHAGSFIERGSNGGYHNTAVLLSPEGRVIHSYRKIHVFGYESREAELLSPGTTITTSPSTLGRIAATTCYDLRFPDLWRSLVDSGAEIVVTPAAWPLTRLSHWRLFTATRAVESQILMIACNAVGEQQGVVLGGHSSVIDPWGNILLEAGDREGIFSVDVSDDIVKSVRSEFPVLGDRRPVLP